MTNPSFREKREEKGLEQSKIFTWEKTAHQTSEIYEKVFDNE